jgi:hypothetical protein
VLGHHPIWGALYATETDELGHFPAKIGPKKFFRNILPWTADVQPTGAKWAQKER